MVSIVEFLQTPQGWLVLAGAGVIIGMYFMKRYQNKLDFEGTTMDEVLHDDIYDLISKQGISVQKNLTKDLHTIGVVRKREKIEQNSSKMKESGMYEDMEEDEVYYRCIVRKEGLAWKILTSKLFKPIRSHFEDVYIIPAGWIKEDKDRINILQTAEFTKKGNIYVPMDQGAWNHVESLSIAKLHTDTLQRISNWVEYLNWLDRNVAREFHQMEKKSSLISQYRDQRERNAAEGEA